MTLDPSLLLQGVGIALTAGVVYGTVKTTLNGTREKVKESIDFIKKVDGKLEQHVVSDETVQRELLTGLARLETKIDERTERVIS